MNREEKKSIPLMKSLLLFLAILYSPSISGINPIELIPKQDDSKPTVILLGGLSCIGTWGLYGRQPNDTDLSIYAKRHFAKEESLKDARYLNLCFNKMNNVIFTHDDDRKLGTLPVSEFEDFLKIYLQGRDSRIVIVAYSLGASLALNATKGLKGKSNITLVTVDAINPKTCTPVEFFQSYFRYNLTGTTSSHNGCNNDQEVVFNTAEKKSFTWVNYHQSNYPVLSGVNFASADLNFSIDLSTNEDRNPHRAIDNSDFLWNNISRHFSSH